MFENKFNSKKADPLVEAAKGAMKEGELRRQAINAVNEEFGVYNRNAVIREHLAAYDARIEEAYKCMKEGKPLADKDYDKDGKIESPKDEVWGSRFRAAKKAGKMEEKKGCYEEGAMDSDVVGGGAVTKDNKQVVSSTAPKADTSGPSAADKAGLAAKIGAMKEAKLYELKKPTAKTAMKAYHRAYDSDVRSGEGERSNRLYKWKQKNLPGKSARNQKDTGKAELDDYDRKVVKKSGTLTKASQKDTKAEIKSRLGKHTKPKNLPEETIEEAVSRKHFQQVADLIKGHESQEKRNELASHHAGIFSKQNPRFDHGRFHKAAGSTAHEAPKKMEEAAYSAKAAREGKDIGKPGKMFSKIAKKAGEKYGSEERGKKVAGAILAKIRAKHMKEQVGQVSFGPAAKPAAKAPIVPKSALAPGQSLRDYMNAKQGLTRRDAPSTTPKPAASTSAPKPAASTGSMQSTPGVGATAAKPAAGLTTKNTPAFNAAQNASEPDQNKELGKPAEKSQSNFLQSQGIGVKPAEKPDTMPKIDTGPKPDSNPDQGHIKLTQTQPADISKKNSASYKSAQDSLAESVQVGANRYRIV
jgi:hypothetical protein